MARMSRTAMLLLLGAAMLVSCVAQPVDPLDTLDHKKKGKGSKVVDCNTYCNGTDDKTARKNKGPKFPSENTPDKCGNWVQGSGSSAVICTCGSCANYVNNPRTCVPSNPLDTSAGAKGYCCSCSDTPGHCACGGTSTKSATFCSNEGANAPATANRCVSCAVAICCASGTITRKGPSFTYNGGGVGTGRIDWANVPPPNALPNGWPTTLTVGCPLGKYSCGGLTCLL